MYAREGLPETSSNAPSSLLITPRCRTCDRENSTMDTATAATLGDQRERMPHESREGTDRAKRSAFQVDGQRHADRHCQLDEDMRRHGSEFFRRGSGNRVRESVWPVEAERWSMRKYMITVIALARPHRWNAIGQLPPTLLLLTDRIH